MTEFGEPPPSGETPGDQPFSQEIRHSYVGALVPAHVARGIFSTGAVVLQGQHEFIVDFVLRMQQPQQVVARIVMVPAVVAQLINALSENITRHENRFGEISLANSNAGPNADPEAATDESMPRQTAQDLYDQLKLPEELMSGVYANQVMIGHSASEFSLDFITAFFPKYAVSSRVFLAAPNAKRLLDSLKHSYQQFLARPQQRGGKPSKGSDSLPDRDIPPQGDPENN